MSNWVVNASAAIPFSGGIVSSSYPYGYYADQAVSSQHGQAVAHEGFPGRVLPGAPGPAPPQPLPAGTWNYQPPGTNVYAWPNQQPLSVGVISGPDQASALNASKHESQADKVADLERLLQAARAQLEQQQQDGRILLAQVESLNSELAAAQQRSDGLGRQLLTMSAAHQALQLEHERLTSQHATVVREHEHMTSSQAATLRELETRHADVTRLQRQLEEAQAAVAAANQEATAAAAGGGQLAGAAAQRGGAGRPGGQRGSTPPPPVVRLGVHAGGHLAAADEERWALRLHKAERALEEERRVSEELRQRLKAADMESRAMFKKLHKLETDLESPSGGGIPIATSDPLPRSPRTLSPMSMPPPLLTTSSGTLAGVPSGQLQGLFSGPPSSTTGPALGRATSAGSGGGMSITPAGAKAGAPGGSSGTPQLPHPQEEQIARLKREVDGLRSDLTKLAAAEEMHRVAARAAEDRARAAELVSLDVRRQCDQAARTIGRLIDENNDLVAKVNAQANALSECKSAAASKEAVLRNLEARLAQTQAQLTAAQAQIHTQARDLPSHPPDEHGPHPPQHQPPQSHQLSNGAAASAAATAPPPPQASSQPAGSWRPGANAPPGREAVLPGGALTEADWKLVMLSEEVRRLVEEVSLSTTACLALQLKLGQGQGGQQEQQEQQQQGTASSLDLPRILSRLEGLAGRRLGPGETAAYIIELAGHMEALEQVLVVQKRRMAALREEQAGPAAEPEMDGAAACVEGAGARDGAAAGPSQAGAPTDSERLRQSEQGQQQAEQAQRESMQDAGSRGNERMSLEQGQAGGEGAAAAGASHMQDSAAVVAEFADGADSSRAPVRQTAFGSFVESSASRSGSGSTAQQHPQQQSSLPLPPPSPQSPVAAPPPSAHHIVSPFNHLAHRKDSEQQQLLQEQQGALAGANIGNAASADSLASGSGAQGPSLDFRHAQRPELAAAAAAAVAAATAAATDTGADSSAGTDATTAAAATPEGGVEGAMPVVLPQFEAPPLPRAAPGVTAAAVGSTAPLVGVAVGVAIKGADPLLDDDFLDEAAVGRVKPRRPRVGLWGWISGEAVR